MSAQNIYSSIIERIFNSKFRPGLHEVDFEREDIVRFAKKLKIKLPKNLGDLIYSFRHRAALPYSIQKHADKGYAWIIRPAGRAKYRFALVRDIPLVPNANISTTKVPDSTPGVIAKYAFTDEQALLAKVRYNRLVDIFTGVTCYALQSHLRTTVPGLGQIEMNFMSVSTRKASTTSFPSKPKEARTN